MKYAAILSVCALLAPAVSAQTADRFTFEVASVKVLGVPRTVGSTGMAPPIMGDPAQISLNDVSLMGVLCRAYNVKPLQVEAPEWMRNDRYAIMAKIPADAPKGHILDMLKSLLEDRFAMKVRWGDKEQQGYALLPGKNGPKLTKSDIPEDQAAGKQRVSMASSGEYTWRAHNMDDFANSLSVNMGAPVVNMTGLSGFYDIKVQASPDSMPGMSRGTASADSPYPTIFTALRELGLNLEARKVTVKHLVVVSANKIPSEN